MLFHRFYTLYYGACSALGSLLHLSVFGTVPTMVYGRFPESPIAVRAEDRYDVFWDFPTDYHLERIDIDNIDIAIAMDLSGCTKIYQYNPITMTLLVDQYWAATITKEGSIAWFGPQNDPSPLGEIAILVPFGWGLQGVLTGATLDVVQTITFANDNWEVYPTVSRQMFSIPYDSNKLMVQHSTWDTDTDAPCIKTQFAGENLQRFDIKEFASFWYQGTHEIDRVYEYIPNPVFGGVRIGEIQYEMVKVMFRSIIDKYNAEPEAFDKYRYKRP